MINNFTQTSIPSDVKLKTLDKSFCFKKRKEVFKTQIDLLKTLNALNFSSVKIDVLNARELYTFRRETKSKQSRKKIVGNLKKFRVWYVCTKWDETTQQWNSTRESRDGWEETIKKHSKNIILKKSFQEFSLYVWRILFLFKFDVDLRQAN